MPTIDENYRYWNNTYDWKNRGDEWSKDWGSSSMQWYGTLLPRIHHFLPAVTALEIGCGFGRWTKYLLSSCSHLIALDVSEKCIAACRSRFSDNHSLSLVTNDGLSLAMIEPGSIDFVFSFDALPLVDRHTMRAYIGQLAGILSKNGVAFLHHSNLGQYRALSAVLSRFPRLGMALKKLGIPESDLYWRDPGVDAAYVKNVAQSSALRCLAQEQFRWGTKRLHLEAFSVLVRGDSSWRSSYRYFRNSAFDKNVALLSRLDHLYDIDDETER